VAGGGLEQGAEGNIWTQKGKIIKSREVILAGHITRMREERIQSTGRKSQRKETTRKT
jgi:hypothetical protein